MGNLEMKLSSCGNSDFGEDPEKSLSPTKVVNVESFAEASMIAMNYIRKYELGSGNWDGGQIFQNNKQVAYVSLNGRVWDMNSEEIDI